MSVLKIFSHIYMYGNVLVVFGVFLGGLGYFEAVGFQKRNLAHYMYGDGLVVFGVFWVGLGYFEAVGFQKRLGGVWGGFGWFGVFQWTTRRLC